MGRYILKTVTAGILSIYVLVTITFFLIHAIPGGPFSPADERKVPPEVLAIVAQKYGLNDPISTQYGNYMKNLLHGDFGISFKKLNYSVNDLIARGFPVTARLGAAAVLVAIFIGVPIGIVAAIWKDSWADWLSRVLSTIGVSIPGFVLAVLMMFFFSSYLHVLPVRGLDTPRHYIMPVIALSLGPIAYIGRLMRSNMLEALGQDYIRTARSKGVKEFFVIVKHALKNSITTVVAYLGPMIVALLTGSFVVEKIFSIPGIGRSFVGGIADRDYSVVLGLTIFFGAMLIFTNIIVDIVYAVIDPRIKFDN